MTSQNRDYLVRIELGAQASLPIAAIIKISFKHYSNPRSWKIVVYLSFKRSKNFGENSKNFGINSKSGLLRRRRLLTQP